MTRPRTVRRVQLSDLSWSLRLPYRLTIGALLVTGLLHLLPDAGAVQNDGTLLLGIVYVLANLSIALCLYCLVVGLPDLPLLLDRALLLLCVSIGLTLLVVSGSPPWLAAVAATACAALVVAPRGALSAPACASAVAALPVLSMLLAVVTPVQVLSDLSMASVRQNPLVVAAEALIPFGSAARTLAVVSTARVLVLVVLAPLGRLLLNGARADVTQASDTDLVSKRSPERTVLVAIGTMVVLTGGLELYQQRTTLPFKLVPGRPSPRRTSAFAV